MNFHGWKDMTSRQRFWCALDEIAHALHLPGRAWICDRFDLSLGVTREELKTASGYSWRNKDAL